MNIPVTPSNLGLFDATPARLKEFKKQQENQAALYKELKAPKTGTVAASTPVKSNDAAPGTAARKPWIKPPGTRRSRRRKGAKDTQTKQGEAKTPDPAKKA